MKYYAIRIIFTSLLSILLLFPKYITAQETKPTINLSSIDLSVPDSPAFHLLGVNGEKASRPSSPRELSLAVLNGVDPNGKFKTGLAIDTAPFILFRGATTTLEEYQKPDAYITRILYNTQTSIATTKGTSSNDDSARLATGIRVVLFDDGDPRQDKRLTECIQNALKEIDIKELFKKGEELDKKLYEAKDDPVRYSELMKERIKLDLEIDRTATQDKSSDIQRCRNDSSFRSNNWNASSAAIGFGFTFDSENGDLDGLDYGGFGIFGSWAIRIADYGQIILGARYADNELTPLSQGNQKFDSIDRLSSAVRLRIGSEKLNFFGEGVFLSEDGSKSDNYWNLSLGVDLRVATDFWLSAGLGGTLGRDREDDTFVLANIKWAFSPSPSFAPAR